MRRLIAGMKLSLDGKVEGADGMADWVEAWSDDYGLLPQIDAVLLGAGMYPGYEQYWTGIRNEPERVAWITGKPPTAAELEYARFASRTSHYVLSKTPTNTAWSNTHFIKSLRRGRGDQAAARQRHLPGRWCTYDGEPD